MRKILMGHLAYTLLIIDLPFLYFCYGLVTRIYVLHYMSRGSHIYMAVSTSMIATIAIIHQSFGPDGATVWCSRNSTKGKRVNIYLWQPTPL